MSWARVVVDDDDDDGETTITHGERVCCPISVQKLDITPVEVPDL